MKVEKLLVTPEIAASLLENNTSNRRIRQRTIDKYAKDMIDGRWVSDTGENIKISKYKVILDGQHRLLAIIQSGVAVWMHIVTELEPSIFRVLDTGASRHSPDIFHISGIKYASTLPSIMQLYYVIASEKTAAVVARNAGASSRKNTAELLDLYYEKEHHWDEIARKTQQWYTAFAKMLPPQTIGGLYATFYDLCPDTADNFMEELCGGTSFTNNSLVVLRKRIMGDATSSKTKMSTVMKHSLIIKTWNLYRKGVVVKNINYSPDVEGPQVAK
jgi:hypothetical protein